MNVVAWVVFGAVAGVVAHYSDTREARGGLLMAVFVGIIGAVLGGFAANIILGSVLLPFDLSSFVLAISGSLIILLIHRTIFSNSSSRE